MGRLSKLTSKAKAAVLRATTPVKPAGKFATTAVTISSPLHLVGKKKTLLSPVYDRMLLSPNPNDTANILSPVYDQIESPNGTHPGRSPAPPIGLRPSRTAPAPPPISSSAAPPSASSSTLARKPTLPPPRHSHPNEYEYQSKAASMNYGSKENHYDKLTLVQSSPKPTLVPNPLYERSEPRGRRAAAAGVVTYDTTAGALAATKDCENTTPKGSSTSAANPVYSVPARRRPSDSDDTNGVEVPARPARPDNSIIFKIAQRPSGEYLQLDPACDGPAFAALGETAVQPERPERPTSTEMLVASAAAATAAAANKKRPLSNGSLGETATDDIDDVNDHPKAPPRRKRKKTAACAADAAGALNQMEPEVGPSFPPPQPPGNVLSTAH